MNRYHRGSIRLKGYDYSSSGLYFVTNRTQGGFKLFGEIKNGKMKPNKIGEIVRKSWIGIIKYFPNVELDVHIIMPDHMHGIICIINDEMDGTTDNMDSDQNVGARLPRPYNTNKNRSDIVINPPHTNKNRLHDITDRHNIIIPKNHNDKKSHKTKPTLGQMVAYFKYQSTKKINRIYDTPSNKIWQRNYYEHIIRSEKDLYMIRQYILNNPKNSRKSIDR